VSQAHVSSSYTPTRIPNAKTMIHRSILSRGVMICAEYVDECVEFRRRRIESEKGGVDKEAAWAGRQ
jgi:hypothetical protein